jgi:peptide deformylase
MEYIPDSKFLHIDVTKEPVRTRLKPIQLERACQRMKAVGIAANQLGLAEPWFYLDASLRLSNTHTSGVVCYRPSFRPYDEVREDGREGCISLPGREFVVQRWRRIWAKWFTYEGQPVEVPLRGFAARVFQHEHDHLRGLTLEQTSKWEIK